MNSRFEFTPENRKTFENVLRRYPVKRAALLPALNLAQLQQGYISPEVEAYVAELLEVPPVDVHEVVTFYTLYKRRPMGRNHILLCTNIACWIRGSDSIREHLCRKLGVGPGGVSAEGKFSWQTVECMGACEMAPMMQMGKDYHGHLTPERVDEILRGAE